MNKQILANFWLWIQLQILVLRLISMTSGSVGSGLRPELSYARLCVSYFPLWKRAWNMKCSYALDLKYGDYPSWIQCKFAKTVSLFLYLKPLDKRFRNQNHNLSLRILGMSEVNSEFHLLNESNEAFNCSAHFSISLLLLCKFITELGSVQWRYLQILYVYTIWHYGKSNARNAETKLIASHSPILRSCDIPKGYCFHLFKAE